MNDETKYGIIRFYRPTGGFGFIRQPSGEDIFFHISDFPIGTEPQVGTSVEFRLGTRKGRELALDVRPLETGADDEEQR